MSTDVLVIGGGPAGLAAATRLAREGASVLVLEREREAGGVPRHCLHQGFGLRDLHRLLSGPGYARRRVELAERAGAQVRTRAAVTGLSAGLSVDVTSPGGRETLAADVVVLATGCRERPRAARLIPGNRCTGVMTTGTLQQLVARGLPVGRSAVVVGAEHVSYSALATLSHANVEVAAIVTDLDRPQSLALFRAGAALRFGVKARPSTRVSSIEGTDRIRAVELEDDGGKRRRVPCDTVVLTADWIPERELAVLAGAAIDPQSGGPAADGKGRTALPGLLAAGNVLRGAEPADQAASEGHRAAGAVLDYLQTRRWPDARAPITVQAPLEWSSPNLYAADGPTPLLLRSSERLLLPVIGVHQGGRTLARKRLPRLAPGRGASLGPDWAPGADPTRGPISLAVHAARRG